MNREQNIFLIGIIMFFLGVVTILTIDWFTGLLIIAIAMFIFIMGILVTWMQLKSAEMVKKAIEEEKARAKQKKKKKKYKKDR